MATPLYKIPSTPVYAICSDFVVLLIFRHIFPVLHHTQIELHTLHQLSSIRVWKKSKERAVLIPPSTSFFTTIPGPNLPSSLSPIPHPVSRFWRILLLKYWSHPLFRSQEIWLFHESRTIFRSIPNPESSLPTPWCYILIISVPSNFPSPDPHTTPSLHTL